MLQLHDKFPIELIIQQQQQKNYQHLHLIFHKISALRYLNEMNRLKSTK